MDEMVLSNIKIISENNSLHISATDLAMELTEKLEAKVVEKFHIPKSSLCQIIL